MDSAISECVEVHSALTVEQCSDYGVVCQTILKAYMYARNLEILLNKIHKPTLTLQDRRKHCLISGVLEKDFNKLRQLMLVEEFKKICIVISRTRCTCI